MKIRSAIDTYRYWNRQAEIRAANGRRVDPVELQSKSGQPLARYFPEVVEHMRSVPARAAMGVVFHVV